MELRFAGRGRMFGVSAGMHGVLLAALLVGHRLHAPSIKAPGTELGTKMTLVYSPGKAAEQSAVTAEKQVDSPVSRAMRKKVALQAKLAPSASESAAAHTNTSPGLSSLGSGNVTVALPAYFPWPRPDLSHLARGTRGDVVVDVTIDEQGRVVDSKLQQSMGDSIDQLVLATVQTWTFKPATKDGVAVPSEQELLFHYEHG